mgnify:FL=1
MEQDQALREHLVKLLKGGQTHRPVQELLQGMTVADAGKKVAELPYTAWQLLEHIRITQWDIVEFSRKPEHQSPEWPDGYWPHETAPADQAALDKSIQAILTDLNTMIALVQDQNNDLYKPFAHGEGQTLLREALLVAQHNAYHLGELIVLRRLTGNWA